MLRKNSVQILLEPTKHAHEKKPNVPDSIVIDLDAIKKAFQTDKPWKWLLAYSIAGLPGAIGLLLATLLRAQGKLDQEDAKNVVEIIKAGSESNVHKMTIKMDRENALGIDVTLGKLKTTRPFRFTAGMRGETEYEINVEFFQNEKMASNLRSQLKRPRNYQRDWKPDDNYENNQPDYPIGDVEK